MQLQAKNKQALGPVYLRYYNGKKQSVHSLGETVNPRHFNDAEQGSFCATGDNATANTAKLQRYIECLNAAAIEEPTWAKIKPAFLALLKEREAQIQVQRENMEWKHKILHEIREGLGMKTQAQQLAG